MKTRTRLFTGVMLLTGTIAFLAFVAVRQNALGELRGEHDGLLQNNQEAEHLLQENRSLEKLREANKEVTALRRANTELPKLRNDVRQLRRQVEEMALLRSENSRLAGMMTANKAMPSSVDNKFSKESLQEVGFALPRSTLETFYAALIHQDIQRLTECFTPETAQVFRSEPREKILSNLTQETAGFTGYEIIDRNQSNPDEVVLNIRMMGTGETRLIHFVRIENSWKIAY